VTIGRCEYSFENYIRNRQQLAIIRQRLEWMVKALFRDVIAKRSSRRFQVYHMYQLDDLVNSKTFTNTDTDCRSSVLHQACIFLSQMAA
jgi:hypothetical protein